MMNRINKVQARKEFLNGEKVYMVACRLRIPSMWVQPVEMRVEHQETCNDKLFDILVNNFEYFNCTNETGRYTTFYTETENLS